jgi:hypothetical protein
MFFIITIGYVCMVHSLLMLLFLSYGPGHSPWPWQEIKFPVQFPGSLKVILIDAEKKKSDLI